MNTKRLALLTCVGLLAAQPAFAQADEYDDRWYLSVFGGWAGLDDDRGLVDNDAVFGLGFGRFFTPNFSVDAEFDYINSEITTVTPGADDDFELASFGLIGRYHLLDPDKKTRPYILAGLGFTDHSGDFSSSTDFYWTAGAGLRFELSDHFSARVQAAYRYDADDVRAVQRDGFDDVLVTAGLTYSFGAKRKAAPAPQAEPAPTPRPTPAPAPKPAPAVDGDDDGDGVKNSRDRCPDTRRGAPVNIDGCEVEEIIDLPGVNFEFDSARLTSESLSILDEAAALLKHHSQIEVEVGGHTDSVGADSYNQRLSEKRAQAVLDYLASKGIATRRMTAKGYGESKPIASNDTDSGRAQNRRTELRMTKK
jgi:OOP family OmpA-OmpF porin